MDNTLETKIKKIIKDNIYVDKQTDDSYEIELYCDYREEIGEHNLAKISRSDDPQMAYDEIMSDIRFDKEEYEIDEFLDTIKKNLTEEEYDENEDDIHDWIFDHVIWYLPEDHFNKNVHVVVALDTGDLNYDFTQCNILNWYGTSGGYGTGDIPKTSPIRWLAKQQGKLTELRKAVALELDEHVVKYDDSKFSKFTNSMVQEMQNSASHMNTFIFMLDIPLLDFIKLRTEMNSEKALNDSYDPEERKGTKEIIISKDTMCGLYDVWGGGGSVLEVELEKDVVLPLKYIWDAWIDCRGCKANGRGYDVDDVYGLCGSAWHGTYRMKETRKST